MRIKSLPEIERPLEKAQTKGIRSLSNPELLGLLIHTGTRNQSSIRLAEQVLARCENGICDLAGAEFEDLTEVEGIGPLKAGVILAAVELGKRIATSQPEPGASIRSSEDVARLFMEELRHEKKEHFRTVLLNTKWQIIKVDEVSTGELSRTLVHPREAFQQAVRKSAAGVVFVHNHPSGDPTPSDEDVEMNMRLIDSGKVLGIRVLDHIIIGNGTYSSMRDLELM